MAGLRPRAPRQRSLRRRSSPGYFAHHIDEERNHDVWTLEDLVNARFDGDAVLAQLPPPSLAAMVGSQYYWILHHHPAALLGYIAISRATRRTRRISTVCRPEPGCRCCLRMHGRLDPHHRDGSTGSSTSCR
ncbi:MAG: hypothetical protein R3D25_12675 [Geminicoccaceae bacterium]